MSDKSKNGEIKKMVDDLEEHEKDRIMNNPTVKKWIKKGNDGTEQEGNGC